jgi:hypothetical protein
VLDTPTPRFQIVGPQKIHPIQSAISIAPGSEASRQSTSRNPGTIPRTNIHKIELNQQLIHQIKKTGEELGPSIDDKHVPARGAARRGRSRGARRPSRRPLRAPAPGRRRTGTPWRGALPYSSPGRARTRCRFPDMEKVREKMGGGGTVVGALGSWPPLRFGLFARRCFAEGWGVGEVRAHVSLAGSG